MTVPESPLLRAARWLTFGSAALVLVSIAASHILLGLAAAALLLSGARIRIPRIWLPLSLFLVGTVLSLLFSGEIAAGMPQVRKFYVFLELVVVYSLLPDLRWASGLFLCWGGLGALSALRGFIQFGGKLQQARAQGAHFYEFYVPDRISGFMSHWMTFSGQQMFALLMIAAWLFFAPRLRRGTWVWVLCGLVMGGSLILGFTRSYWFAAAVAGAWLIWHWRPWMLAAVPVVAVIGFLAAPASVRERAISAFQPRKDIDSNLHRVVTWRTGLEIIRRHPWLGLGPEGVKSHFREYLPPDVPRPLPSGSYEHLHNVYLQYAAERGIPTMLAMMWMLLWTLRDFWRGLRRAPPGRSAARFVLQGGVAIVVATMLAGVFEHNLGDSEILGMFLTVVACGYLALDQLAAEKAA